MNSQASAVPAPPLQIRRNSRPKLTSLAAALVRPPTDGHPW